MVATTETLRERTAEKLKVKSVDLVLDDETAAKIDNGIADVTNFLREKGLAWWADDAIPDGALMPMILLVSAWLAPDLGKAGQGYESGWGDGQTLLTSIKPSAAIDAGRADYF